MWKPGGGDFPSYLWGCPRKSLKPCFLICGKEKSVCCPLPLVCREVCAVCATPARRDRGQCPKRPALQRLAEAGTADLEFTDVAETRMTERCETRHQG